MEQAERANTSATDGVTRSQHVVHTLPHTTEALTQLLAPALERVDATQPGVQLCIVTADAETAVTVSDLVYQIAGQQGIEVVPVTSANRAARLMIDRPIHVVVGPAVELQALVQRSILKLADIRTIVLSWADDIIGAGDEGVKALEVLFGDISKEASRFIVTRQITPEIEQLIERYARTARRVKGATEDESAEDVPPGVQYLVASVFSRASVLHRLLDDTDPPSAAIVVRTDKSRAAASQALAQLGYRRADDAVRVVDGAVEKGTHTVVLFDAPVTRAELANVAEGAVNTIVLVTPQELEPLRVVAGTLTPFTLSGPGNSARRRERLLHDELAAILANRAAARELVALEPLLQQYDGAEIAAAAIRLLERERAKLATVVATPTARLPREDKSAGPPASDRGGDGSHDRWTDRGGDSRPKRDSGDRPSRDFGDRPKHEFSDRPRRDFNDRPKRDFGDRPKRDFGDRPRSDFGDRPKRDFNHRHKRYFGDRPKRDFSDRPRSDFGDRPKRDFSDRPKRDFGDRPKGNFGKPKRDFGGPHKGNFGRGPRDR